MTLPSLVPGARSPAVRALLIVFDLILLALLVVIVVRDDAAQLFKVVLFLLTLAAFFWDLRTFLVRAAFWSVITTVVVIGSVIAGRAPLLELIDVVYFVAVLALVFTVNSRREASAMQVQALLAEKGDQVDRLLDQAEIKADFTAMVVHEFGNPLAALRRLNEMMRIEGLDPEARAFVLESTRTELSVLETLVADISATATIERDDFRVEQHAVEIARLVDQAETYGRSVCGQHSFRVVASDGLRERCVVADPDRIAQVIRNLISNAAKYSPPSSAISVRFVAPTPDVLRVEVADEGRGINPEDLDRIFDKFGRAAVADSMRVPGVGLGLYICRRLIRAHGSELTVSSDPGRGSTFAFDLQLLKEAS